MDLDAIVVSVSGGGMASGVAVAAKHLKPAIKSKKTESVKGSEITNWITHNYYDIIHNWILTNQKIWLWQLF